MASTELQRIREQVGVSRARAAAAADVSEPTLKMYELAGPDAVKSQQKRASLDRYYAALRDSLVENPEGLHGLRKDMAKLVADLKGPLKL